GGGKTYRLLATAMKKEGKVALAQWVAAGREHLVIIRPYEDGLVLHTMYYADEVRDFSAIEGEEAPVREKEMKLAEMLIAELTEKKFNPLQFKDEYRERLLERIRAKSRGKAIVAEERDFARMRSSRRSRYSSLNCSGLNFFSVSSAISISASFISFSRTGASSPSMAEKSRTSSA